MTHAHSHMPAGAPTPTDPPAAGPTAGPTADTEGAMARRTRITSAMAVASILVALLLILTKAAAWAASGSVSLLASLADSALDLAISIATFLAVRYAAKPPDDEHRFGHGKAEAFAGLFQAGAVALSAVLIGVEASRQLLAPEPIRAEFWALAAMVFSISMTGALVAAQTWAIRRTGSIATAGDRAHYAADFLSNLAVIAGIVAATRFGLASVDALVGLAVAATLMWGAWKVAKGAADQLMDRELDEAARAAIVGVIRADPQILGLDKLRTRASGPLLHVEGDVLLPPALSLSAARLIMEAATGRIIALHPGADVRLHAMAAPGL